MIDWFFFTVWNSIVWSLKITFLLVRGIAWGVSAFLNLRQNRASSRPTDLMDK